MVLKTEDYSMQAFLGRAQGSSGLTLAGLGVRVTAAGVFPPSLSDSSLLLSESSGFPAWAATGPAFPELTGGVPFWEESLAGAEVPLT